MLRSFFAFRFSMDSLIEASETLRMWTFTMAHVAEVRYFSKLWNALVVALRRQFPTWAGIRVFEWHAGEEFSRGLHVHFVTPGWFDVDIVRAICIRLGWGRCNVVTMKTKEAAHYVGKYLAKGRSQELKGLRKWAVIGPRGWKDEIGHRCKDIAFRTTWSEVWAFLEACAARARQAKAASAIKVRMGEAHFHRAVQMTAIESPAMAAREKVLGMAWESMRWHAKMQFCAEQVRDFLTSDFQTVEAWGFLQPDETPERLAVMVLPF